MTGLECQLTSQARKVKNLAPLKKRSLKHSTVVIEQQSVSLASRRLPSQIPPVSTPW